MNNKIKILYIQEPGESADNSFNICNEFFKEYQLLNNINNKIELIRFDWDENDFNTGRMLYAIEGFNAANDIDIVIGNSLGGYYAAGIFALPKILLNPVLDNKQICAGPTSSFARMTNYNNLLWNKLGPENVKPVAICVAANDELIGNNAYSLVNKLYPHTHYLQRKLYTDCGHQLNRDCLNDMMYETINIIKYEHRLNQILDGNLDNI